MAARATASGRQNAVSRQNASGRAAASGRQSVSGGGGAATDDMTFLEEKIVAGGGSASETFSAISGAYRQLMVFFVCGCDQAAAQTLLIRFNADASGNYDYEGLVCFDGGSIIAAQALAASSLRIGTVSGTGDPAGIMTSGSFYIPYYATTTQDKAAISLSTYIAVGPLAFIRNDDGVWRTSNAAITSITLLPGAGNFVANSRFALYGIT